MKLSIRTADNGWIISCPDYVEDEKGKEIELEKEIVISDTHTMNIGSLEHCKALQELLYEVMERLNEYSSKHDEYRVCVVIKDNKMNEIDL